MINKPSKKGVNLDPKTSEEALALLRWTYGPQVPGFSAFSSSEPNLKKDAS